MSNYEASTVMLQERYKYNVMGIPSGEVTPNWRKKEDIRESTEALVFMVGQRVEENLDIW